MPALATPPVFQGRGLIALSLSPEHVFMSVFLLEGIHHASVHIRLPVQCIVTMSTA